MTRETLHSQLTVRRHSRAMATSSLPALLLASPLMFAVAGSQQSGAPEKPLHVIAGLADRMYVIGETTGKPEDWRSAIERARQSIHDYVRKGGDPADLAERDAKGRTPLIAAASMGYPDIVRELLTDKRVADGINDIDASGRSAWTYANFALGQSVWVCNPAMTKNIFALVPIMVTLPYYLEGDDPPYRGTRKLLESAGAKSDMDVAKQQWLDTCKSADAETRRKVAGSNDLLETLEKAASENLPLSNGSPTTPK